MIAGKIRLHDHALQYQYPKQAIWEETYLRSRLKSSGGVFVIH
jgi:hypothetical protein